MMKNMKMGTKICTTVIATLIIGLVVLWLVADGKMSSAMRDSTIDRLTEATQSRTEIINQYLSNAETFFKQYGQADVVVNLLKHPNDTKALNDAFSYSERYAAAEANLEGLYIADMQTKFLFHTNKSAIGGLVREDEARRNELLSTLFTSKEVMTAGILTSPASGKQVIADYYPIYDEDGTKLGMVGGGILADKLM
ncbi:MAG: PDC sensor domain-containing protein, partial [Clostridiales bacterium]|nr:PDC sensor domain-containing protein [Clostridiales bacterium]